MIGRIMPALCVVLWSVVPALADDFEGYECTQDCSGHEAGYNWAEENDITDPADCDGNSNSFNEGCQAWVDENGSDDDEDDE
jgi:hypothetical protein